MLFFVHALDVRCASDNSLEKQCEAASRPPCQCFVRFSPWLRMFLSRWSTVVGAR